MKALLPVLFVVIAVGLFMGFINPAYKNIKELRLEEAEFDAALTRAKELQTIRDQLLARYNTFARSDLTRLGKLLPDHVDNVRLILDLDGMASRYGMRVRNVAIENDTARVQKGQVGPDEGAYESVVLSFVVSGTYDTFRSFLIDLEKSLRLVDVVGLSFTANETGIYDVTVRIKTYWLKP